MDGLEIPLKLLVSFAIGAVIGLEREINEKKSTTTYKKATAVLGLRTFSLTTGLGALAGFALFDFPLIAAFIGLSALILFSIFYTIDSFQTKDTGITTEIALIYSFVLGALIATELIPIQVTLAATTVLVLLLSRKDSIKEFVEDIKKREINAFIAYAILAAVILPFLPNTSYSLTDIPTIADFIDKVNLSFKGLENIELVNPFKLWLVVVLITGVDVAGYILEKTFGQKKGWVAASLAGGFISSTATTVSLARESEETGRINPLVAAALFANMVSFIPVLIILATLNVELFLKALPLFAIVMAIAGILGVFFLRRADTSKKMNTNKAERHETKIFSLTSALKFAGVFLAVSIVSRVALELFGQSGFLVASAVGALPGIDAVVINTAQLVGERVTIVIGLIALIIINGVNLGAKSVYSLLQGEKEFAIKFAISSAIIVGASLLGLLFA